MGPFTFAVFRRYSSQKKTNKQTNKQKNLKVSHEQAHCSGPSPDRPLFLRVAISPSKKKKQQQKAIRKKKLKNRPSYKVALVAILHRL